MTTTIYQIYCKDPNITETYIGSTKNLKNRISRHRSNCMNENNLEHNRYVYKFIRNNGGINNWEFKVLNQILFYDKEMQLRQEQCYIDLIKPELNNNKAITGLTKKEYDKIRYNEKLKGHIKINYSASKRRFRYIQEKISEKLEKLKKKE